MYAYSKYTKLILNTTHECVIHFDPNSFILYLFRK